jgi:hypothetical protein
MKLPKWGKWLATDKNGEQCAYENKPIILNDVWVSYVGRHKLIAKFATDPNWKNSLRAVGDTPATARDDGAEHYTEMDIQPWDVIDTWPREQQIGFYRGNLLKYTMRMGSKDIDQQEIKKAEHYARKLQEVLSHQEGGE